LQYGVKSENFNIFQVETQWDPQDAGPEDGGGKKAKGGGKGGKGKGKGKKK